MKTILIAAALGALACSTQAGTPVNTVQMDPSSIGCLFSTNCTNQSREKLTSFKLARTTGKAYLGSRVVYGEPGTPAAGHYGYEYRLDLSGLVPTANHPPCLYDNIRCRTEVMEVRSNMLTCVTNFVNLTNLVLVTNVVNGTNLVSLTHQVFATNMLVCTTNRMRFFTNMLVCTTNSVPCPDSPAFVQSLRLEVGPVLSQLDLNHDGSATDQVYVAMQRVGSSSTSTNTNTNAVANAQFSWDDNDLIVTFSPPLSVGSPSFTFGIVALGGPRNVNAKLKLSPEGSKSLAVVGPKILRYAHCDFTALATMIQGLPVDNFDGNSDRARERNRSELLDLTADAQEAALADKKKDLKKAMESLITHTNGKGSDWVTRQGATALKDLLDELRDCLDSNGDDDDDDDHGHHD